MARILVVEDSPTVLYKTTHILSQDGHQTLTASDGESAIEVARDQRPDAILLDVVLPKLNGFQVCRKLKSTEETQAIPIILITSKTSEEDRDWGIEQGADAYLTKPYAAVDLLQVIRDHT
ncbi:MAG: response regulator [Chloroflexi bacterium]|nr:response regulator [Chloroflexota bacterium]